MTKQNTNAEDVPAPKGDGDPVEAVTALLLEHFNNRWGQGAPVTASEASGLAATLVGSIRRLA